GSAYPHRARLEAIGAAASTPVTIRQNIPALIEEFRAADMAVVAGGLTMHETLAVGAPSLTLSPEVWHQEVLAQLLEAEGVMVNLGRGGEVTEEAIAEPLDALAMDANRRRWMSREGQRQVDGRGTRRVAELLLRTAVG